MHPLFHSIAIREAFVINRYWLLNMTYQGTALKHHYEAMQSIMLRGDSSRKLHGLFQ